MTGVIETTNLSNDELGGVAEVTGLSPAMLAAIATRSAAGVRIVRGAAAAGAIVSPFSAVEDLDDPVTDDELTSRLTPAERTRRRELAERGYDEGRAQGHREGYEAGRAEAMHELAAHAASSMAALQQAVIGLHQRDAVVLAELDDQVAAFALDLVSTILGREVAASTDPGRDALARALQFVPDRGAIVARMHPDDLALLGSVTELTPGREIDLVADAGIERGGCVLDVGACRIDAQLSTAMARVADVLDAGQPAPHGSGGATR